MPLKLSSIVNNLIDIDKIEYDRSYSRVARIHKYWSRKPWFIIDRYIQKYSKPHDLVLDPFCGSGIIGLQAILENRNFTGYDLNPFAAYLAKNSLDISYESNLFEDGFLIIEKKVREKIMSLYKTGDKYIVYNILGKKNSKNYNAVVSDKNFQNKEKINLPENELRPLVSIPKDLKYPDNNFPTKFYKDRFSYKGVRRVSDMFSKRNLLALAILFKAIKELDLEHQSLFMLAFTNTLLHVSKLKAENVRPLSVNNFWIPDDYIEENVWWRFVNRVNNIKIAKKAVADRALQNRNSRISKATIFNKSSLKMAEIKTESVDYLITDPPYGDAIQYSELSFIWNCWLEKEFDIEKEVIINPVQNKGTHEYYEQLSLFILEARRVLKKNAYFTLAFQNKDLRIWITLAKLIRDQGMDLVDISSYDTFGSPYNKNWAKFSPKSDFYVTFKNSHKILKTFKKKVLNPSEIALEINEYLGKNNGKVFDLNKAYDLFVSATILKIFDGSEILNSDKLNIENITKLFKDTVKGKYEQPYLF